MPTKHSRSCAAAVAATFAFVLAVAFVQSLEAGSRPDCDVQTVAAPSQITQLASSAAGQAAAISKARLSRHNEAAASLFETATVTPPPAAAILSAEFSGTLTAGAGASLPAGRAPPLA